MGRINEEGPHALLQIRQPVNRFPDLVRYIVRRLKLLCPRLGKVKIAEIASRTVRFTTQFGTPNTKLECQPTEG